MDVTIDTLKIEVNADIKKALTNLNTLNGQLKGLGGTSKGTGESFDSSVNVIKSGTKSMISGLSKLTVVVRSLRQVFDYLGKSVKESMDYSETVNLFQTSMRALGKKAGSEFEFLDKAEQFSTSLSEKLSLDPDTMMNYQAVFAQMSSSMGVTEAAAYDLSESFVMLGADIASLFNTDVESAYQKLQSALSGQARSMREFGVDISMATMQEKAFELGINKSVTAMTQAEKVQLRYIMIMEGLTVAQGDMARTLESPANQLRILSAQFVQLTRSIGNIFIPVLTSVLPYINAVVLGVKRLATHLASLVGYELPDFKETPVEIFASDDVSDTVDGVTESVKALKKATLGIDEINVLNDNNSASAGAGVGDSSVVDLSAKIAEMNAKYKSLVDSISSELGTKAETILDGWIEKFKPIIDNFKYVLQAIGFIGAGIAGWKLGSFIADLATANIKVNSLKEAIALVAKKAKFTLGITLAITGFAIEITGLVDSVKNGLDGVNFAEIIGGGIIGTGGLAILGSTLATWIDTAFGSSAVSLAITQAGINLGVGTAGAAGAAIFAAVGGIIAGIPAYFVGIYNACKEGLDWLSSLLIGAGATAAGAGIGAIIGMCGGPIGAGVGALIGLAVGAITDLVILIVQNWESIVTWCGNACAAIGQFFTNLWNGIVGVWNVVAEWFNTYVIQPIASFFSGLWEGISSAASACWNAIVEFFTPAVEWFSQLFGSIFQTISDIFYNIGVIASGCWEIIKAIWNIVSAWFNENVIQPVASFFSGLWNGVKNVAIAAWDGIKSVFSTIGNWVNTNIIQPVGKFFTGLWNGFVDKAKAAWEGVKSVFSKVATFFSDTFKKAWQGIVKVFSIAGNIFVEIKDGIVAAFKVVVNGIIKGINSVVALPFKGINGILTWLRDLSFLGISPFSGIKTINIPQIPLLAEGGIVSTGQMFIAREAGPEMVGTIGRQTAVANNEQIVEAISRGVSEANYEQNAILRELVSIGRQLLEKDTVVNAIIGTNNIVDGLQRKNRRDGKTIVPVGI